MRLYNNGMNDAAFLRAIVEHPADDTPRLIYADYLEEQGQGERAEFVRVQCELAATIPDDSHYDLSAMEERREHILVLDASGNSKKKAVAWDARYLPEVIAGATLVSSPPPSVSVLPTGDGDLKIGILRIEGSAVLATVKAKGTKSGTKFPTVCKVYLSNGQWKYVYGEITCLVPCPCRACRLRDRDRELLHHGYPQFGWLWTPELLQSLSDAGWSYRRGFIDSVTVSFQDWLTHGPQIVEAVPTIREVRLLDKRPCNSGYHLWGWSSHTADSQFGDFWVISDPIAEELPRGNGRPRDPIFGRRYWYAAENEAIQALSEACLVYARRRIENFTGVFRSSVDIPARAATLG